MVGGKNISFGPSEGGEKDKEIKIKLLPPEMAPGTLFTSSYLACLAGGRARAPGFQAQLV